MTAMQQQPQQYIVACTSTPHSSGSAPSFAQQHPDPSACSVSTDSPGSNTQQRGTKSQVATLSLCGGASAPAPAPTAEQVTPFCQPLKPGQAKVSPLPGAAAQDKLQLRSQLQGSASQRPKKKKKGKREHDYCLRPSTIT